MEPVFLLLTEVTQMIFKVAPRFSFNLGSLASTLGLASTSEVWLQPQRFSFSLGVMAVPKLGAI
jgi:hypothetical protein